MESVIISLPLRYSEIKMENLLVKIFLQGNSHLVCCKRQMQTVEQSSKSNNAQDSCGKSVSVKDQY